MLHAKCHTPHTRTHTQQRSMLSYVGLLPQIITVLTNLSTISKLLFEEKLRKNNHCLAGKNIFKNQRVAHFFSPMSVMAKREQQLKRRDEPTNQPMKNIKSIRQNEWFGTSS